MINKLYSEFFTGNASEIIGKIIDDLVNYTVTHFRTEESFFERVNYINKTEHIAEHQNFVNTVVDFKEKLSEEKTNLSYEIMNFLRYWLQKHILESDKDYIPYLEK